MEIEFFDNVSSYIEYAKSLSTFPFLKMGEPLSKKEVYRRRKLFRYILKRHEIRRLVSDFASANGIEEPTIVFTRDKDIEVACFKTTSKTIYIQAHMLRIDFWYNLTMLVHELSHYLIYLNKDIHEKIMKLSKEVKVSLKEHNKQNNIVLPEELYANALMCYLLSNLKEETKIYIDSLFEGFKKEIATI